MLSINKISSIALYVMLGISVIVIALFYAGGSIDPSAEMLEPVFTDPLLYWTYALVALGIVCTFAFAIYQFIILFRDHPKAAINNIVVLVAFALILIVSWALGDGTPLTMPGYDGPDNVYFWLKATDMFLYTVYFMLGAAILAILSSSVIKLIRK